MTVGALVGYSTTEFSTTVSVVGQPGTVTNRLTTKRVAGGAFADVGAQWLVAPQLALGASWQAQATVGRQTENRAVPSNVITDATGTLLALSLGRVAIRGTLYF